MGEIAISQKRYKEVESDPFLFLDVTKEEAFGTFVDKIIKSDGKALFFVHPFSPLYKTNDRLERIRIHQKTKKIKHYIGDFRNTVQRISLTSGIPTLFLEEKQSYRKEFSKNDIESELAFNIKKELGISGGVIYYLPTKYGTPAPMSSGWLNGQKHGDSLSSFIARLKDEGLTKAWVAGAVFGSSGHSFNSPFRRAGDAPVTKDSFGDIPKNWWAKNAEYRSALEKQGLRLKHPLKEIEIEGCAAEFFEELTRAGIKAVYTQLTYPKRLPHTAFKEKTN